MYVAKADSATAWTACTSSIDGIVGFAGLDAWRVGRERRIRRDELLPQRPPVHGTDLAMTPEHSGGRDRQFGLEHPVKLVEIETGDGDRVATAERRKDAPPEVERVRLGRLG